MALLTALNYALTITIPHLLIAFQMGRKGCNLLLASTFIEFTRFKSDKELKSVKQQATKTLAVFFVRK